MTHRILYICATCDSVISEQQMRATLDHYRDDGKGVCQMEHGGPEPYDVVPRDRQTRVGKIL